MRRRSRLSHETSSDAVLLGLLAGDERLDGGMRLDKPREQRTLVHVVEHGRKLQGARQILDDLDVGGRGQFAEQFLVIQNEFAQAVRAFLVELVALHRREHGAENFRAEDVGKGVVAVASEPEQQFAAGGVLADEPRERLLEQIHFAALDEQAGQFAAQLRGGGVQRAPRHFRPAVGVRRLERFQRAVMFRGGNLFEHLAEFDAVLQPDLRVGDFLRGGRASCGGAQFVARKNRLQRDRRLRALVRRDVRVQRRDDFTGRRRLVRQIRNHLENFRDHRDARLQPLRRAEIREQRGPAATFPAPEKPPARFFSSAR